MKVRSFLTVLAGFVLLVANTAQANTENMFHQLRKQVMAAPVAPVLPRDSFNWQSPLQTVLLSPDGLQVAYVLNKNRFVELWRYDVEGKQHVKLVSVKNLGELHWAADGGSLYFVSQKQLYRIGNNDINLANKVYDFSDIHTEFHQPDPDIPDVFWLSQFVPRGNKYRIIKAYADGRQYIEVESAKPIDGFYTHNSEIKLVKQWVGNEIQVSQLNDNGLSMLTSCGYLAPCSVHHWDSKAQQLLLTGYFEQDTRSLFLLDINSGEKTLLHQDPNQHFDIHHVTTNTDGKPFLVSYQTEFAAQYGLSENAKRALHHITAKFGGKLNLVMASQDEKTWLVTDADPAHASRHVWIWREGEAAWIALFKDLKTQRMEPAYIAPRVPFWYSASDGKALLGYVTLPLGIDPKNAPLVVNPHGGPWNRSQGAFNRFAQFLANRGYVVFEPNFRSSTGLGRDYLVSANKDFGRGRVQQDIIDGVDVLLSMGVGHPQKLAVAGHSFGGFSALNALAFTPTRFQVAFAGAAPANLTNTILRYSKTMPPSRLQTSQIRFRELMVDTENAQDVARLYDQSPSKHWQQIQAPLYLWAGELDDRVAIEDVRDVALRLKSANKPVFLLSDPKAGHSPSSDLAREAYLYVVERALASAFNGKMDSVVSPKLARYLKRFSVIDTVGVLKGVNNIGKKPNIADSE